MLPLRFRRRRRFTRVKCVAISPRQTNLSKAGVAAYVDEGCIYECQLRMRSSRPRQPIKPREYHPYIAALLIALAQATYNGEDVDYVEVGLLPCPLPFAVLIIREASVLFSEKPSGFSKEPVHEFHLYSASIPLTLLKFSQKPKHILPACDTISVTGVLVPVDPWRPFVNASSWQCPTMPWLNDPGTRGQNSGNPILSTLRPVGSRKESPRGHSISG